MYLSTEEYPTRSAALACLDTFVRQLNSGHPLSSLGPKKFGEILDRYIADERLLEIKQLRPGQMNMGCHAVMRGRQDVSVQLQRP